MDLGDLFKSLVGGVGIAAVLAKWDKITSLEVLRLTIRSDIRPYDSDLIQALVNTLGDSIRQFRSIGATQRVEKATVTREILIEEARGLGLM